MTRPATVSELHEKAEAIADAAPMVEGYAPNVIIALLRVMRDLPGIGRDQTASAQQGGYPYRGIEQITVHTQGLFARHGVVFTPHTISYEVRDLIINNKPWTDVYELIEYTVYGPGGVTDYIKVGPILAIGRDNSDKGGNKCLTQAYKYALIQALNISDAKDDADGTTHEADALPAPWNAGMVKAELLNALMGDKAEAKAAWEWASGDDLTEFSAAVAHDIATRWLGRPMEPADDSAEQPALPLDGSSE